MMESNCKSAATRQTDCGLELLLFFSSLPGGRVNQLFQAFFLTIFLTRCGMSLNPFEFFTDHAIIVRQQNFDSFHGLCYVTNIGAEFTAMITYQICAGCLTPSMG